MSLLAIKNSLWAILIFSSHSEVQKKNVWTSPLAMMQSVSLGLGFLRMFCPFCRTHINEKVLGRKAHSGCFKSIRLNLQKLQRSTLSYLYEKTWQQPDIRIFIIIRGREFTQAISAPAQCIKSLLLPVCIVNGALSPIKIHGLKGNLKWPLCAFSVS